MSQMRANSTREIITVNIGGFGVNMGQCTLEQYCVEQGISKSGSKEHKTNHDDYLGVTFKERINGKYKARSLFVDLDPLSIHMMQNFCQYIDVLNEKNILHGKSFSIRVYSAGHYTTGKELIEDINMH